MPEEIEMPLFGGTAHGQWKKLPQDPCLRFWCHGDIYTIHCTMPPNPVPGDTPIWFAGTEEALRTIRFDDVQYRYTERHLKRVGLW